MKAAVSFLALVTALSALVPSTNTKVATRQGNELLREGKGREAVAALRKAEEIDPSPVSSFNLGTAAAFAGDSELALRKLQEAASDPSLRPDALFNRGTAAMAAEAWEEAIDAFERTLRIRPADREAKRNLEIALRRKQAAQQQQQQQQQRQQQQGGQEGGGRDAPPDGDGNDRGEGKPAEGQADLEALLRAVEQQEREELSRMRRGTGAKSGIDW